MGMVEPRAPRPILYCVSNWGGWLPGSAILPELIRQQRDEYIEAIRVADASLPNLDLSVLHALVQRLLDEQLASANGENGNGHTPSDGDGDQSPDEGVQA